MRAQHNALMALLRRMLARMGWRFEQTGSGTQFGQVSGDVLHDRSVTIHHHYTTAPPSKEQTADADRPAPPVRDVVHVYKRRLTREERRGTDRFMAREFQTTTIISLSPDDRRRLWAYMQACLRNRVTCGDSRRPARQSRPHE
ncbi:MAG: hypothetical protein Q4G71_03905 [Pseudomonadota bacterium]|nr:hypothetical protein [Pseudomonadota bacterium]